MKSCVLGHSQLPARRRCSSAASSAVAGAGLRRRRGVGAVRAAVGASSTNSGGSGSIQSSSSGGGGDDSGSGSGSSTARPAEHGRRSLLLGSSAAVAATAAASAPWLWLPSPAAAAERAALDLEGRVKEFTLGNGLHFCVLERHNAPVVSCHIQARVGAWNEQLGATGLAHLLEHLAFKGTPRIGSRDWRAEAPLLAASDEAFYALREIRDAAAAGYSGSSAAAGDDDAADVAAAVAAADATPRARQLSARLKALQAEADALAVPNAFGALLQQAGAVGLNAATSHDCTRYTCSLPSNKLELWVALEAERWQAPAWRQLYTEKEVIVEERRARYDNAPLGRFTQDMLARALDNNYALPVIGLPADFARLGAREVAAFYRRFYHPQNLSVAVVGDVDAAQVQRLAERYFGGWAAGPDAVVLDTGLAALAAEPLPQPAAAAAAAGAAAAAAGGGRGGRGGGGRLGEFAMRSRAGPLLALGFYRPTLTGRRGVALEVAADALSGGRAARLQRGLVQGSGRALSAGVSPGYPGEWHSGLALVSAVPAPSVSLDDLARDVQRALDAFADGWPEARELARVTAGARAALLAAATSNASMAALLAAYHQVGAGSWRGLLQEVDDVESLSRRPDEVAGVAAAVFDARNCFQAQALASV